MALNNDIPSLAQLRELRKPIRKAHEVHKETQSLGERFAATISKNVGSITFFVLILVWTIIWLTWNTFGPAHLLFDPSPTFQTWVFLANVIQLSLMPLILVGQNMQTRANEIKENEEYQLDTQNSREIETILLLLEKQNKMIEELKDKVSDKNNKK
jgi:uncharacterized membrane protein